MNCEDHNLQQEDDDHLHNTLQPTTTVNGHLNPEPTHTTTNTAKPRYRECLRNHAVGLGLHAVDGCGEFIPAVAGAAEESLTCAACNCHRSFHRREQQKQQNVYSRWHNPYVHVAHPQPPQFLALPPCSGGGGRNNGEWSVLVQKRHRTKFTQEQKQKMLSFAEKVEWRVPRQGDEVMQRFCDELGITRQVFKVWMHNNKNTLGKNNNKLVCESSKTCQDRG